MNLDATLMQNILIATLGFFSAGALGSIIASGTKSGARIVGNGFAILGSMGALALALAGLSGGTLQIELPNLLPIGGVILGMDRLSAFFILIIAVGAIPASIYALDYTREIEDTGKYSMAAMGVAFNLFLAAMLIVTLARNVLTFLALWEAMSLASYFLVMTENDRDDTQRAGWVYLVMTHVGFAALLIGFLFLAQGAASSNLNDWHSLSLLLSDQTRNIIFILLALGFGSKAGVIPLHIWLPRAHPAAPSHVSALMSGVMIKLGVYGLIRVAFDWLGAGPAWWGGAILTVAAISAVLGILYALIESDLKRLLAYSSVENIGIILLGVGAGMLFQSFHFEGLAALALLAALYHALNHTAIKSLLFMGAGAILHTAHTRNMEEMGGLIKRMPQTAILFLIGSLAIAALPPFNGFISEWLTFQALLLSFQIPANAINLLFVLAFAALALTSGLAAAGFVKTFGISFLALPRSEHAAHAREVGGAMRLAMALLALVCVALGIAPFIILPALNATTFDLIRTPADFHFDWNTLVANNSFAAVSPLWIAVGIALILGSIFFGLRALGANTRRRYYETWGCGRALQTARFEYTATAFSNPFKRVFGLLYRPVKELDIEFHPESRFFIQTITYSNQARSIFEDSLYRPLLNFIRRLAQRARVVQSGNVHSYLLYILIALIVLLLVTR